MLNILQEYLAAPSVIYAWDSLNIYWFNNIILFYRALACVYLFLLDKKTFQECW